MGAYSLPPSPATLRITLSASDLFSAQFEHLTTVLDVGVVRDRLGGDWEAACLGGFTEWVGEYRRLALSLGWDWILTSDGSMLSCHGIDVRTNVALTDSAGAYLCRSEAEAVLRQLICDLRWEPIVRAIVLADEESASRF